jgi:hypothetical protein
MVLGSCKCNDTNVKVSSIVISKCKNDQLNNEFLMNLNQNYNTHDYRNIINLK